MDKYQKPSGSYISFMSNKVKTYGGINLAQGIPGFQPPEELLAYLGDIASGQVHQYAPGNGNQELLDLLVQKYAAYGEFDKDHFLVTNGATEAVSLIYTCFNQILPKPFAALAFDPVYESYKKLPEIFGDDFIPFSYEAQGRVNFAKLEEVCKKNHVKVIFLNTPGNPFGKIWKKEEIEGLMKLSLELDLYIVLDAVYQDLYFGEKPFHPLHRFNERMFYVNSFSKIFSITGWRIGYMIAPENIMPTIRCIHDYTGLCAPSVLQAAIVEYIKENDWGKDYVESLRQKLREAFDEMKAGLEDMGFYIPEIGGGFFIWACLPEGYDDGFRFAIDLYEQHKVAVIPGEHFSDKHPGYIRLNIARKPEELREGLLLIRNFLA